MAGGTDRRTTPRIQIPMERTSMITRTKDPGQKTGFAGKTGGRKITTSLLSLMNSNTPHRTVKPDSFSQMPATGKLCLNSRY